MGTMLDEVRDRLASQVSRTAEVAQLVDDYLDAVRKLRDVQVRNRELQVLNESLGREAGELREEAADAQRALEQARSAGATSAEVEEARARAAQLQAELVDAYKEKSDASEGRAAALQQLEVVRGLNAQQAAELESADIERKRLLEEIGSLRAKAAALEAARDAAAAELTARAAEAESAALRLAGLEDENRDLVMRVLELKDKERERLDAATKMGDDIKAHARREAAEILAKAQAQVTALKRSSTSSRSTGGVSSVRASEDDELMARLAAVAVEVGAAALPARVSHAEPGAHPGGCFALAMDHAGRVMASCGADKVVKLWDVATATQRAQLRGSHQGVNDVAFSLDGKVVLGAEDDAAVRIWDVATGRSANRALTGHTSKVTGVSAVPWDPNVAVTAAADRTVRVWDLGAARCIRTYRFTSTARRVAALVDTALVVSGHFDGKLRFWDTRTPRTEAVREVQMGPPATTGGAREIFSAVPVQAGGAVVTCSRDNAVRVVDTRAFEVRATLCGQGFNTMTTPWAVPGVSPSGSHVIAGSDDGTLWLWEITKSGDQTAPKVLRPPKSETQRQPQQRIVFQRAAVPAAATIPAVVACVWSPTGAPVVSCDRTGGVSFWAPEEEAAAAAADGV